MKVIHEDTMAYILPSLKNNKIVFDYNSLFRKTCCVNNPMNVKEQFRLIKQHLNEKIRIEIIIYHPKGNITIMEKFTFTNIITLNFIVSSIYTILSKTP